MIDAARPTAAEELSIVRGVLARHANEPGALLPILHDVQDALRCIPDCVLLEIARGLNLSRAEVHGVVSFYHHFRSEPPARNIVQICRAESCQSMGAEALFEHAKTTLGCGAHGRSRDGTVTLQAAYCLGLCAMSPALTINDDVHARMSIERFDALLSQTRESSSTGIEAQAQVRGLAHARVQANAQVQAHAKANALSGDEA